MDKSHILNQSDIEANDKPELVWVLVSDAVKLLWNENPKLHSIGDLITSIEKYGWQELPVFDKNLINVNGTEGAIKAGNGRIEALSDMEKLKKPLPRGVAITKNGEWALALIVGVDAENINIAKAYALDSNNLVAAGGSLTAVDMARMWDSKSYLKVLNELSEVDQAPVTVDRDTIGRLSRVMNDIDKESIGVENKEKQLHLFVVIECESEAQQIELIEQFTEDGLKCKSYSK